MIQKIKIYSKVNSAIFNMDILESYIKVGKYLTEEKRPEQIRPKQKGYGFALKAYNGKYVTTRPPLEVSDCLEASKEMSKNEMVDEFSQFYIEKIDENTIALKMDSGKYLSRFVPIFFLSNEIEYQSKLQGVN